MSSKMGMGALGSPNVNYLKRFRWTLEGEFPNGKFEPQFVKVAARPNLSIEEEVNFLGTKTWNPNKPTWSDMKTTFLEDCNSKELADFLSVLSKLNEEMKVNPENEVSFPEDKKGVLKMNLYDGMGVLLEEWHLHEAYPTRLEFAEFSHDINDPTLLDVTWRYNKVVYKSNMYKPSPASPSSTTV